MGTESSSDELPASIHPRRDKMGVSHGRVGGATNYSQLFDILLQKNLNLKGLAGALSQTGFSCVVLTQNPPNPSQPKGGCPQIVLNYFVELREIITRYPRIHVVFDMIIHVPV